MVGSGKEFFLSHGSGPVGSGRGGAGRGGAGRLGSGRVGSGRVGSGRVGSGRVGSGRVGSGRIGSGHTDPIRPPKDYATREKRFYPVLQGSVSQGWPFEARKLLAYYAMIVHFVCELK